jgi:hypothetical protein
LKSEIVSLISRAFLFSLCWQESGKFGIISETTGIKKA